MSRTVYVRPGFLISRVANPINRRLGLVPVLTVVGRTSGSPRSVPIGRPFEFEGARYLVSGRGETHWVRNLRAAGRADLAIHRRHESVRAIEVLGQERDRVVGAWRHTMGHGVDRLFSAIPELEGHPVFRLVTAGDADR